MQRFKYFIWFFIAIVLTSCGRYKDITVGDFEDYKIKGFDANALVVELKVPVKNPSIHKITIYDLDARVFVNDKYIGKVTTDQKVVLRSRSEEVHDLELKVRMANFLGTAASLMNIKRGEKVKLRLEGTFKAKSVFLKKEIEVDETSEVIF